MLCITFMTWYLIKSLQDSYSWDSTGFALPQPLAQVTPLYALSLLEMGLWLLNINYLGWFTYLEYLLLICQLFCSQTFTSCNSCRTCLHISGDTSPSVVTHKWKELVALLILVEFQVEEWYFCLHFMLYCYLLVGNILKMV